VYRESNDTVTKAVWGAPIPGAIFVAWIIKTFINMYYTRRVSGDELELAALKAQQKSKLEEFARQTDFYKTRDILNRYAKTLNSPQSPPIVDKPKMPITPKTPSDSIGLRHRNPSVPLPVTPKIPQEIKPIENPIPPPAPGTPVYMPLPPDHMRRTLPSPLPKPPLDPNRPWYDKLVDYLVGDDLEQSTPLLCEKCGQNNGLIPKEEMQTIQFKCKYCQHFNEKGSVSNATQIQTPMETQNPTEAQNQTEIQKHTETQVISEKEEINQEEEVLEAPNDKKED
jgi:hypothetical protein